MRRTITLQEASTLALLAQSRALVHEPKARPELIKLLRTSAYVGRVGSAILGRERQGITASDRRVAKAYCHWADNLDGRKARPRRGAANRHPHIMKWHGMTAMCTKCGEERTFHSFPGFDADSCPNP